jgi:hypothetical protein
MLTLYIRSTYAEDILSQEQTGFKRNRSTTDNIFIMRQILEKCYEYKIEIHVLFIDFKNIFDSVDRQKPYRYYRNGGYQISWCD